VQAVKPTFVSYTEMGVILRLLQDPDTGRVSWRWQLTAGFPKLFSEPKFDYKE